MLQPRSLLLFSNRICHKHSFNDFAISQVSKLLGKTDDAQKVTHLKFYQVYADSLKRSILNVPEIS